MSIMLRRALGWFVVLQGTLFGMFIIAVFGGTDIGLHLPAAILWTVVAGFLPVLASLIATCAPRIAARIDLCIAPLTPLLAFLSPWRFGGSLMACVVFSGAIVIPGFFWLLTARHNWPPLLQPSISHRRFAVVPALGFGLFCILVVIAVVSSLLLPWWSPIGDCHGRSLFTDSGVPQRLDFTARIVFVGPRSFQGLSLWSVARVEQRFAGLPSWIPNLIILRGYFRPTDRLSHYFVEGRRSEGLIAGLLPVIVPAECGHTARLEDSTIALRIMHDGPPNSGARLIGKVYATVQPRRPASGVMVRISGPTGNDVVLTTDEEGIYDVSGLPPGHYRIELAGRARQVNTYDLVDRQIREDAFYLE